MSIRSTPCILAALLAAFAPAVSPGAAEIGANAGVPAHLECVPYARQVTGIRIFGDAHTWWNQAEGRYARGRTPQAGAVMAFRPHGNSRLGHVAAVSRVIDSRTVLIRHANWSRVNGRRGQIEDNVRAIDVSANNDWSEVRVWYDPIQGLGTTHWPLAGFIYNQQPGSARPLSLPPVAPKPLPARSFDPGADPIGEIIARSNASRSR
jgi:surface antigen